MFIFFWFNHSKGIKTMSCRIDFGCKMFISAHQCMRYTFNKNKEILVCRRYNTFTKSSRPVSIVKLSHLMVRDRTIRYEQDRSQAVLRRHQALAPLLACNLYSNDSQKKSPADQSESEEKSEVKLTLYQKFKKMCKEYWYVLIPVHVVTSCFWFGSFYYMAASGINIPEILEALGAPDSWIEKLKNSKAGNVVLAYTLYKVATPVRYTVTVGGTTISINYLVKLGWIKPVPNKEQIKRIYQEQKDVLKDLKVSCKDKMQVTKTEYLKTKRDIKKQFKEAKEELHESMAETRDDLKEGVKRGVEEWKFLCRIFLKDVKGLKNTVKEEIQSKKKIN